MHIQRGEQRKCLSLNYSWNFLPLRQHDTPLIYIDITLHGYNTYAGSIIIELPLWL